MPRSRSGAPKSFFCNECNKRVRLRKDWSRGASVRKHYWQKHPHIMRSDRGEAR